MLIIGNWKMNPVSEKEAVWLVNNIEKGIKNSTNIDVVLAPPFPWIKTVKEYSKFVKLGAQNVFWENQGAFTGEISPLMLKNLGVEYVIIGHSERRKYQKESDKEVTKKTRAVLKAGLKPVVAVGEDHRGSFNPDGSLDNYVDSVVGEEVKKALSLLKPKQIEKVIFAYEPVWAISATPGSQAALPDDVLSAAIYIRKVVSNLTSVKTARRIKVLYGGSVDSKNISFFIKDGGVDGFLVGGASLKADEFVKMIKIAGNLKLET